MDKQAVCKLPPNKEGLFIEREDSQLTERWEG